MIGTLKYQSCHDIHRDSFTLGLHMLIAQEKDKNKIQFRIRVQSSTLQEVEEYCQWADIQYRDYFIQRACEYIFTHDEQWVKYKNEEL